MIIELMLLEKLDDPVAQGNGKFYSYHYHEEDR